MEQGQLTWSMTSLVVWSCCNHCLLSIIELGCSKLNAAFLQIHIALALLVICCRSRRMKLFGRRLQLHIPLLVDLNLFKSLFGRGLHSFYLYPVVEILFWCWYFINCCLLCNIYRKIIDLVYCSTRKWINKFSIKFMVLLKLKKTYFLIWGGLQ
jgi:hypothetical protein